MPADISKRTHERRNGYSGVVAQQGRVILDRDFNAAQETLHDDLDADALNFVGPCGTPDDGFAISFAQLSPPSPPFWSPPEPLSFSETSQVDFLISPGTMYVCGRRVVLPAEQHGAAITYSYFDQPDWPNPDPPVFPDGIDAFHEAVYLDVIEHEVSAVEDPDLLEVALGGPDTTGRLRLLRRIKRKPVTGTTCLAARDELVAHWATEGLVFDRQSMRLAFDAGLEVSFTQDPSAADPCDPVASGGYLGADNQVFRVQISAVGSDPQLLWGRDNASFMYRIERTAYDGRAVQLTQDPPDVFHYPQTGQVVEILRTAAVIGSELDDADPSAPVRIVRAVAEAAGVVRTLVATYGPVTTGDPNYLYFSDALPAEYLNDTNPLFVRIWQGQSGFTAGTPCELIDPVTGGHTGIEVTIAPLLGGALPRGAFWSIAARPGTPQAVYPEAYLTQPQPPDGPKRWVCLLAVIDWNRRPTIHDCRESFDNLVALTKRRPGCCTVSVTPADLTGNTTLQAIVDRAAARAQPGTIVCFAPGVYALDAPLRLDRRHSGMTLEGCGAGATLRPPARATEFSEGLVILRGAENITLRGITFIPPHSALPAAATQSLQDLLTGFIAPDQVQSMVADMRAMIGLRVSDAHNLHVEDCVFRFNGLAAADVFGAGIFFQGTCPGAIVRNCLFGSAIPPTFTPLAAPASGVITNRAIAEAAPIESSLLSPPSTVQNVADVSRVLTESVRTSFSALASNVIAVLPAPRQRYVSTIGCLAQFNLGPDGRSSIPCDLGDVTLENNTFVDLTFGVYGLADIGTARFADNSISSSVNGFWLQLPYTTLPNAVSGDWPAVNRFAERFIIEAISLVYPFPSQTLLPAVAQPFRLRTRSLFVTNNQIEVLPVLAASSHIALVLLFGIASLDYAQTGVSLIVSSNQLRNRSRNGIPTAFIVLPDLQRCAMTANLILNEGFLDHGIKAATHQPSLVIFPVDLRQEKLVRMLAVTGNVLQGGSTIGSLSRNDTGTTWADYNFMEP